MLTSARDCGATLTCYTGDGFALRSGPEGCSDVTLGGGAMLTSHGAVGPR